MFFCSEENSDPQPLNIEEILNPWLLIVNQQRREIERLKKEIEELKEKKIT